ncbi:hypothetical protein SAMN05444274_104113 [Mariniphaga anaerophila]|uniref:Uncharacterized protein n=1 Tax=Mariniphaga anaerophila TaxID=1484053 RepID=A0A1M4ZZG0_9BACT|nr:hypothetical protein SAMN05444274_104113 [Mariniphaga anaerophila]
MFIFENSVYTSPVVYLPVPTTLQENYPILKTIKKIRYFKDKYPKHALNRVIILSKSLYIHLFNT